MAWHIPFVNTEDDCHRLTDFYSDSVMLRVSLDSIDAIRPALSKKFPLWIDPSVAGYHHILTRISKPSKKTVGQKRAKTAWENLIDKFQKKEILGNADFLKKPDDVDLKEFVTSVLDLCLEYKPNWITVPQLPLVNDVSRNKVNRSLAKATYEWKSGTTFEGKLVLPLIFTNQQQYKGKTERNKRRSVIKNCYEAARASVIWAVDTSLSDRKGSGTFRRRFSNLIEFHKDLLKWFSKDTTIIAGPYWGMNLVLWARELCDYPAISLGSGYQYHIPGPFYPAKGSDRVAIPPLRRSVVVDAELRRWLTEALKRLDPKDSAYQDISSLKEEFDLFLDRDLARNQVAKFYKQWFDELEAVPAAGRPLALYQVLSSAFVFGKKMPKLSRSEGSGGDPAIVAQQLMLNCF